VINRRHVTMKRLLAASLLVLTPYQVHAMDSLSAFEWKNRVIVVFGNPDDLKLGQQIALLESEKGELAERDLVIIRVAGEDARAVYGTASGLIARAIRKEAGIEGNGFHVILVGKDGGVKLRSDTVIRNVEIFGIIDQMPMRKAEQS
jgi:hypothetical protein